MLSANRRIQYLIAFDNQYIINKTLRKVKGDVWFMMQNGCSLKENMNRFTKKTLTYENH